MSLMNVFNIAGAALTAQSQRLNVVASNLANADSAVGAGGQPYKAREVVFAPLLMQTGQLPSVRVAGLVEDQSPARRLYDPKNPLADPQGYVSMPNVNVIDEMVNMISASRSYASNVEMMNTAKNMMQKALALGQ
jgi:flagellar basal-body rod protein FlgC